MHRGVLPRARLLASSALTTLALAALTLSSPAHASCAVTVGGSVICSTTTTTNTTNTNGGTASSSDRIQLWSNGVPIVGSVLTGATISGAGLQLQETGAIAANITMTNNAGATIASGAGAGVSALSLIGNGGLVTYNGAGSILGSDQQGILATNSGFGGINISATGSLQAGDSAGGDNNAISTSAVNGATTIDLTGATLSGASANGMSDSAAVLARSVTGNITITANELSDHAFTGIDAAITGTGAGRIQITQLGDSNVYGAGISAVNNSLGGIAANLNSGASILATTLSDPTYGEYLRVTGAGGGITATNQAGSLINADYGVDAQVINNASSGNVTVHQDGGIVTDITGIIAATNGTGNVLVDGAGAVQGGTGATALDLSMAPITADNYGIAAANIGTAGGVTVSGTGTTSGTTGIGAYVYNSANSSDILIDRSGAISVTGVNGVGVYAKTNGLGDITVQNTGTVSSSGAGTVGTGIYAAAAGGDVLIKNVRAITVDGAGLSPAGISAHTTINGTVTIDGTSTITSTGKGINAGTVSGDILITHTGNIASGDRGIDANSSSGNITITPAGTVSGTYGIAAQTNGAGTITITLASGASGNVTGTARDGINSSAQDGATLITNNAALVQGAYSGAYATGSGTGTISITGSGNYAGTQRSGIWAQASGIGPGAGVNGIVISGTGNATGTAALTGFAGIGAVISNASNHADILINRSGTVTGGSWGIDAETAGDGDVTITNVGTVTASGVGIEAQSQGGDIVVMPASTVLGSAGDGILAGTTGTGTITVTTAFNAAGNITAGSIGIHTSAVDGATTITNNAATVTGGVRAVDASSTGLGAITIGGVGIVGAGDYVGGTGGGIYATLSGTGPAAGLNGIRISGTGITSATGGDGIRAVMSSVANHSNILINRSGTVTVASGGGNGIYAATAGDGDVTVTNVTGVVAGTGSSAVGIDAQSHGGDVLVTPAGTVSGGNGIHALTTGSGTVTVTTITGAPGNVTGLAGYGIATSAEDGNTVITANAATVSGTTYGISAASGGLGRITIQGPANVNGGTAAGISAVSSGAGSAAGTNGIYITGSGNTSATTGIGIVAQMTSAANHSNILIDRTGTVTVAAGGSHGISATTAGDGDVTIHNISNVVAGTGASAWGITAASGGGDVLIDLTTPLYMTSTVSGGNGISAATTDGGTVTVTTYTGTAGNVTGSAGYGVQTSVVDGNSLITNNAARISGATWAAESLSTGAGRITVTGAGDYVGGSAGGIHALASGMGPGSGLTDILITGTGNTSSSGFGIDAAITNAGNASDILVNRTGTVTVTNVGIRAHTAGTGNVKVTGVGNVTGGSGVFGILAQADLGGNVLVTPAGTVTGGGGIYALATAGGSVTVTTASGSGGNVRGLAGPGIQTIATNGATVVTNNAATVSGTTWAATSSSSGTGTISITGAGDYVGGTGGGIQAQMTGAGPAAGQNGIVISGSGKSSATTGIGIKGAITSAGNASNILINRSGSVTVAAGGSDGIDATTAGSGNVSVTGVGNVVAGTGATTLGILAQASGGNVLVTPAGSVIAGGIGIKALTTGAGTVTIATVGDITGTSGDGILANSVNGAISITTAARTAVASLGTGDGIHAQSSGLGSIAILANSTVSGDPGIHALAVNGPIAITANATVTGLLRGIDAEITGAASSGALSITGTGNVIGGTDGIYASVAGSGNLTIDGSGNTTAGGGTGIIATSNSGDILVNRTGTVTATADGIDAQSTGGGDITVSGVGNISGSATTGVGILAIASGGDGSITVTPAGTVSASTGVGASAIGAGTITVATATGAIGNVIGSAGEGILTSAVNGNTSVTNNAALVSGSVDGVSSTSTGAGTLTITGSGTYSGGSGYGITAVASGAGPGAAVTGILVGGAGNTTSTSSSAIHAVVSNAANASDIVISRSGAITAGETGIDASTSGVGDITISGVGAITAGASSYGIVAAGSGGDIAIAPASTIAAGFGIRALTTGSGTITVTTASGANGNITTGTAVGIFTTAVDGNTVITNAAATVSSPTWALSASSSGVGTLTITGSGDYAGGAGGGITTAAYGPGPAGVDAILISGSGNTSATTGFGIEALIGAANAGNIHITRSGSTTVQADGTVGITAATFGSGAIIIDGVGNVTAGTAAPGIKAIAAGGNVQIRPAGTVVGGQQGIRASTLGAGSVSVTVAKNVTGGAADGILTNAVDGATTIAVNAGSVTGNGSGNAGVHSSATGAGAITVTVASNANVTGGTSAMGIALAQTGTGQNLITNNGTIMGAGTPANPVISMSATGSRTNTINNSATGIIRSANATAGNREADVAIYTPVSSGAFSIQNAGTLIGEVDLHLSAQRNAINNSGTWNLRNNASTAVLAASLGTSGANTLTNAGTINAGNSAATAASTFAGVQTITNSGTINAGLSGSADVTTFTASGAAQTMSNSGTVKVHGLLAFEGGSSAATNTGTLDMRTSGAATTDLATFNVAVSGGATHLSNTYAPGAAYNFNGGANSTLGLDTFIGAVGSTGSSVPSDRLLVSGNVTGNTGIAINDTNGGPGAYNPIGITLVAVNGTSSNAFSLQSVAGTGDVLQSSRGPMGSIKKGFWVYPLLQTTHAVAAADGLSGTNASEYRLYGLPDAEALELPFAITGAESIWYDTAAGWTERQNELRDDFAGGSSTTEPGVWLKVIGHWTDRDVPLYSPASLVDAASALSGVDLSYNQNTYSVQAGIDKSWHVGRDGLLVAGLSVGYVESSLSFKSDDDAFGYSGANLAGSLGYLNGPFFIDTLIKGDFLNVDYDFKNLTPFGYSKQDGDVLSWGVLSSAGLHLPFDRDNQHGAFIEPLLSFAYTRSDLDDFSALGTTADYSMGETLRGAIGGRLGARLFDDGGTVLNGALTGKYWYEFTNKASLVMKSAGPDLQLNDAGLGKGYGEITAMLNIGNADGRGVSGYIDGGAKFGSRFTTIQASAGIRYQW